MTAKQIRRIGSLIVTGVIAYIIITVFPDRPVVSSLLCLAIGLGLAMGRFHKAD